MRARVETTGSGCLATVRLHVDPDTPPLCDRRGCPGMWPNRWRTGQRMPGAWHRDAAGDIRLYCSPDCADLDTPA
jgi:hypothetical protein